MAVNVMKGGRRLDRIAASAQRLERVQHSARERLRVQLTGEVQAVHKLGVAPLMEGGRGLIVLQPFQDRTVDHHLVVLQIGAIIWIFVTVFIWISQVFQVFLSFLRVFLKILTF